MVRSQGMLLFNVLEQVLSIVYLFIHLFIYHLFGLYWSGPAFYNSGHDVLVIEENSSCLKHFSGPNDIN